MPSAAERCGRPGLRRGCPSAAEPPDLKVLQGTAARRRPWEQELLAFMGWFFQANFLFFTHKDFQQLLYRGLFRMGSVPYIAFPPFLQVCLGRLS